MKDGAPLELPGDIPVDIGWRCCSPQAALAFFPPEPLWSPGDDWPDDAPLPQRLARRILQIRAPYNVRIRKTPKSQGPARFGFVPEPGGLSQAGFNGLAEPIVPTAQRKTDGPTLQMSMNLMMLTEEDCAIHLTAPFMHPSFRDWPGTLVSGRFPLRSWPRPLNAALEWQQEGDWVLKRGSPMAYVWFHFDDPAKVPNVFEAELTPALKRHFAQVDSVSDFARGVSPMFQEAERRRPARLLTPKRTGCPDFS